MTGGNLNQNAPEQDSEVLRGAFENALMTLKQELKTHPTRSDRPQALRLKDIRQAPEVFQARQANPNPFHVAELQKAIRAAPKDTNGEKRLLDPVTLWPCGRHFVLIDGYHRVEAYRQEKIKTPVPVQYFDQPLEDAISHAIVSNSRDKMPMTTSQKLDSAWRMVLLWKFGNADYSIAKTAQATGCGTATVSNMRKRIAELEAEALKEGRTPAEAQAEIMGMKWWEAKKRQKLETDDDAEIDRKVRLIAEKLSKTFGSKLSTQAHLAAMGIALYSPKLPAQLVACWNEEGLIEGYAEDPEVTDGWDDEDPDGLVRDSDLVIGHVSEGNQAVT